MGLLAHIQQGKQQQSSKNDTSGGTTGGFENTFDPQELNSYNFEAFKRGDFSSFDYITPEQTERSKKTAKEMKEQRKLHTGKMAADSDSLDAAAAIFKSEQYHLRRRGEALLSARGEWTKTQAHFNEKLQPALHEQNQSLSLSQTKGQNAIGEINEKFNDRRAALQQLRNRR